MKKQNNIIRNLEAMTEVRGGTIEVTRYRYIREAIVEMKFGRGSNLTVSIGPRGGIKYCSWFVITRAGDWFVHHDRKYLTGTRNADEVRKFFDHIQPSILNLTRLAKEAA